jgi:hypothetical protein
LRQALQGTDGPSANVEVSAAGSVAVIEGYESPYSSRRTVVTLLANDASARSALAEALDHRASAIHGDVVVVRGESLHAYRSGQTYYVGDLPLGRRAWYAVSRHPVLATLTAVVLVSLLGFLAIGALRRRAARRLGETGSE